ncbi:MAG: Aminopeptidase N [Alphaproteobacteria bacterium MarineAlpha4_Bin2]|nr:MAG: Aminopeptidase N [Alphaproteobacteria bacterium MarineAlpha4_Bin2]
MSDVPATIHLADYREPEYAIRRVDLEFQLDEAETKVSSRLSVEPLNASNEGNRPLVLDGEGLELLVLSINGVVLEPDEFYTSHGGLTILDPPATPFALEIAVRIRPQDNTLLEGLYKSSGNFCTQCEAEGFRRVTYYLDRPDVTSVYSVRIEADKAKYPILLSNGNPIASGEGEGGRHWVEWYDPHPKPSYLFALVAGNLAVFEDTFTTLSGRNVALRIYVEHGKEGRCGHAMESLKKAMRWDEERFGLEYDLDIYMIVAVSDFNMGAMENKGLNVFNDKYILADAETATDSDYEFIEAIVAHEYFHNWTGNRVTLRDWFQLSLKEGLTVFRDQEFSKDVRFGSVKRIQDVRTLRARQFPEDAGPLAHPVRPASYIEINNFYTATVYEKGAELIRMLQTILGRDAFTRGVQRYLSDNDGRSATVEDFIAAMESETGADLTHFMDWYGRSGTPKLTVEKEFDVEGRCCTITLKQSADATTGEANRGPLHIPVRLSLLGPTGEAFPLRLDGEAMTEGNTARIVELRDASSRIEFVDIDYDPVVSALQDFSAPVTLSAGLKDRDRAFLMAHDPDPFNRWEAGQQYATGYLLQAVEAVQRGDAPPAAAEFIAALSVLLTDHHLNKAFVAEAIMLPSEEYLGNQMARVDVEAIHTAREALRREIATSLRSLILEIYHDNRANRPYDPDPKSAGQRKLKNGALGYLVSLPDVKMRGLAASQFETADNMTDTIAALACLKDIEGVDRNLAFTAFYERWRDDTLVLDKWFSLQAMSSLPETLDAVVGLLEHPAFSLRNPNKVRALIGAFCAGNQLRFHAPSGAGYQFLATRIMELDELNPQVAARLLAPLGQWRRFDLERQSLMCAELKRILGKAELSRDVFEVASKSLE